MHTLQIKTTILLILTFFISTCFGKTVLHYDFYGIHKEILHNVKARIEAQQTSYENELTDAQVKKINQQRIEQIRLALQPYGYFKPNIVFSTSRQLDTWYTTYQVNLGQPLLINKVEIKLIGQGKENTALKNSIGDFPLKKGDVFDTNLYNKGKENFFEIANNQGYIKAEMKYNQIIINLEKNEANIILHFQTGERYFFGPVTFSSQHFDKYFLSKFISFGKKKYFSSKSLMTLRQQMENTGYFKQVLIKPEFDKIKNHHIPIKIKVSAPKSQKYNIGLGYGTFTHTRISGGVSLRNLTNRGHHFDAEMRTSAIISALVAKYYIPGNNPLRNQWVIGADIKSFTPKNVSSRSSSFFLGYETKFANIKSSVNLNYLIERYRIKPEPTVVSKMLYPRFNLNYVKDDDLINPTFGKSIDITLQGSSKAAFSSTNFIQGEIKAKIIYPFFTSSRIVLKADVGYTIVHDIRNLPATLRFYADESHGLRGFSNNRVGPGRYLAVGSIEYQQHLKGNWYAALFHDIGKASNHFDDPFNQANGVGIIYKSVIGPIKLYGVHALQNKSKPYSIVFSIGPEF